MAGLSLTRQLIMQQRGLARRSAHLQRVEDTQEATAQGVAQHGARLGVDKHQQGLGPGRHILNPVVLPLQLRGAPPGAAPLAPAAHQLQAHRRLLHYGRKDWHGFGPVASKCTSTTLQAVCTRSGSCCHFCHCRQRQAQQRSVGQGCMSWVHLWSCQSWY